MKASDGQPVTDTAKPHKAPEQHSGVSWQFVLFVFALTVVLIRLLAD